MPLTADKLIPPDIVIPENVALVPEKVSAVTPVLTVILLHTPTLVADGRAIEIAP